jgi:predicted nucleic acid-binding protein
MDARAIVDSGFIAALWDRRDPLHSWAAATAPEVRGPWLTCEACVSEIVFLLGDGLGAAAVLDFYEQIEQGLIISVHLVPEELARVRAETSRYRGRVVDFADASLMVLSDRYPRLPLVTIDVSDFSVYVRGRKARKLIMPPRG